MSTQSFIKTVQGKTYILVMLAILFGGTGLLVTPSQPARASHLSEGIWARSVNTCAIDESDLGDYAVGKGLNHKTGIGKVAARCNVENLPIHPPFDAPALQLIYQDPDGPGTAYQVIAQLVRITNSGKTFVLATVDSNQCNNPPSTAVQSCFAMFSHDFDFSGNAYWVSVTVFRNDTAQTPAAAIVRITGVLL